MRIEGDGVPEPPVDFARAIAVAQAMHDPSWRAEAVTPEMRARAEREMQELMVRAGRDDDDKESPHDDDEEQEEEEEELERDTSTEGTETASSSEEDKGPNPWPKGVMGQI